MKLLTILLATVFLFGCGKDDVVELNDHKDQIDANTQLAQINEAENALQNLRLDAVEARLNDLENRADEAEAAILANEQAILDILNRLNLVDAELIDLREELANQVDQLILADDRLRRDMMRNVRMLCRKIVRRTRHLDNRLDDLEEETEWQFARQQVFNRIISGALFLTNLRINRLSYDLDSLERDVRNGLVNLQGQIDAINGEIFTIQQNMGALQSQLNDVESRLVSVVYPCGEGNSEEVLLQTQDGLVAYFQKTRNVTRNYNVGVTIPEHFVCTKYLFSSCLKGHTVPQSVATDNISVTEQVLQKAYLDVLADGNYRTTDGFSCNFTIQNGEVL